MTLRYLILLVFLAHGSLFAQNNTLFERATEAYNAGEFNKSIEFYEKILGNEQHSAELYFNLGNAYYKLGEIGPSIYYYEKALLLKPSDNEIKNNLSYANNMRLDAIEAMPKTAFSRFYDATIKQLSFDAWAYLAVSMIFLFVACYVTYYLLSSSTYKRITFITSLVAMGLCVASILFAYLQYEKYQANNPAVIFSREVTITAEPNENSERIFTLHEGTKVNVEESFDQWQKIKIADGQTGWLPKETIRLLKDF